MLSYVIKFSIILNLFIWNINALDKPPHDKVVVCYVRVWAIYRQTFPFSASNIDPSLCTHLVHMWARLEDTADNIRSNIPHIDLEANNGNDQYRKMTALKLQYPHLKVLLSLGGSAEPINFKILSRSEMKRKKFAKNAVDFLRKYGFDGLDIYWFQDGNSKISDSDKNNFPLLLKEVKNEFSKNNLLLTTILSGSKTTIDRGFKLEEIAKHVDWINVNAYNYHTPNDRKFGIHAPMKSKDNNNVEFTINYYLEKGVPVNQIVMRVAGSGFGYTNADKSGTANGMKGLFDEDNGFLTIFEICDYLSSGWTTEWDTDSSTPVAFKESNKISYDDQRSIRIKAKYVKEKHLLGIGFSSLDVDDFKGVCKYPGYGKSDYTYPLLKAINKELNETNSQLNTQDIRSNNNNNNNVTITIVTDDF